MIDTNYFTNYCRVCMVNIDIKNCSNIFLTKFRLSTAKNIKDEESSVFMAEIIEKLTCVKLNEFDQFPKHICLPCEKRFIGACVFKQQLEWSTVKYNGKRKAENKERQRQQTQKCSAGNNDKNNTNNNNSVTKYKLEINADTSIGTAETLDDEIFSEFPAMAAELNAPKTYKIINPGNVSSSAVVAEEILQTINTCTSSTSNNNIISNNIAGDIAKNNNNNDHNTDINNPFTIENIEIISDNNEILSCIEGEIEEDIDDDDDDDVDEGNNHEHDDDDENEHYQILIDEIKNEPINDDQSAYSDYNEILIDGPKRKRSIINKRVKNERIIEEEDAIEFLSKYKVFDEDDDDESDVGGDEDGIHNNTSNNTGNGDGDCDEEYDYGNEDQINIEIKKMRKLMRDKKRRKKIPDDPKSKRHICHVCMRRFLRHSNLVDHLRLHAGIKLFKCDVCEKSFVQKGNLDAHYRIHTKERPFGCKICNRSYNQSSALAVHIKTHTREKDFECDICPKRFTNSSDLIKHKRIHDVTTQYKCPGCDKKTFAQRINLKTHIRKHHPDLINVELPTPPGKKKK